MILVSVVALLLASAGSTSARADAVSPALRITDLTPLTVRGTHFRARERVRLLVNAGEPFVRKVRAGSRGRFVAKLGLRVTDRCTDVVVQAIGRGGSRAMVERTKLPGCDERP